MLQYLVSCFPRECKPQSIETHDSVQKMFVARRHVDLVATSSQFRNSTCEVVRLGVERRVWLGGPLKVSVCYEFLFELYFCENTILETPRKLWPCLFATFSLTRHDDVMRRWSPDVDSNTPDVGRRSQGLGCGQVLLAASR